jgi:hypothetical protein
VTGRFDVSAHANDGGAALRATRIARGSLRRDMASGRVTWQDVILDPPDCVESLFLSELLLMVPGMGRHRVEVLAERAFQDGITLVVRCGRSSTRTRQWVVDNLFPRASRSCARPRTGRRGRGRRTGVLLP